MLQKLSALAAALTISTGVLAAAADQVAVRDAYVRLAPPGAPATAAFMRIRNSGDKEVQVVKADSPAARATEIHNHINDGGVMRMRPVPAIAIKARDEAVLQPGGMHIMLIDLKAPIREGDTVPITLDFGDGSSKTVAAKVLRPGMSAAAPMEHHH